MEYWIWFEMLKNISKAMKCQLIKQFHHPFHIYHSKYFDLTDRIPINREKYECIMAQKSLKESNAILDLNEKHQIKCLTWDETPNQEECSFVTYYKGNLINTPSAAIIGTRNCSRHGDYYTETLCQQLTAKNICINGGLSQGIEFRAHHYAITHNGGTQAFLAHGLDQCYPKENHQLLKMIIDQGAAISSFPVGTMPYKSNFVKRNQQLSAWSQHVIVVEAGEKSGALSTARYAISRNRKVSVIDVNKYADLMAAGAHLYEFSQSHEALYEIENDPMILLLKKSPLSMDEVFMQSGQGLSEQKNIEMHLIQLEAKGWISFKRDGRWYYNGW